MPPTFPTDNQFIEGGFCWQGRSYARVGIFLVNLKIIGSVLPEILLATVVLLSWG